MAWRPTQYLLEGELDNTTPGRVTGWMRFAGLNDKVTFDLEGNFHRDIRGAKIGFRRTDSERNGDSGSCMAGFALHQTGQVGDITAGREPRDYVAYPYLEWYGTENGRVVIELSPDRVEVIGRPIPACESDPIPREQQQQNMAGFLADVSQAIGAHAVAVGQKPHLVSDPKFTHWVVEQGRILGEARSVEQADNGMSFAYVRLFGMAECAEYGYIATSQLRSKNHTS